MTSFITLRDILSTWDDSLMTATDESLLDKVGIETYKVTEPAGIPTVSLTLAFEGELSFSLPGVDGISLILGSGSTGTTTIDVVAQVDNSVTVTFSADYGVRFSADLLTPMKTTDGGATWVEDETKEYIELTVASTTITFDSASGVSFEAGAGLRIVDPVMIGDTNVIIESADIELNLDGTGSAPAGAEAGWKGLMVNEAAVRVPEVFAGTFTASGLGFGSSGVTGTIGGNFGLTCAGGSCSGDLAGGIFGLEGGIESISLSLQQNIPSACAIIGQLYLPFFECETPLGVSIGISSDGAFAVSLSNATDGIASIDVGPLGVLQLNGIAFGTLEDATAYVELAGSLDLAEIGGIDMPEVSVNGLRITSEGDISMASSSGITLEQQVIIDLKGFQIEIDAIGFGTEDDKNFVSFSGGIKLTEVLPMGVSAKGLRVLWLKEPEAIADGDSVDDIARKLGLTVTCEGVGIEFEIPNVLSISGSISFDSDNERFTGKGALSLISLDMTIDVAFIVGKAPGASGEDYRYFGVQIETQLPFGIPLGNTGIGLFGFAGLFAQNMAPLTVEGVEGFSFETGDTREMTYVEDSFDWYKDWYRPSSGFYEPWTPQEGAFGFGVGVVLGTQPDNGYMISIDKALVFAFPGPIIMLQGKGNILCARTALADESKTPIFSSLILFDGNEKSILAALGMDYMLPAAGETGEGGILDAHALSEAFFDFDDPENWHVYLGEKEKEKRIRAEVFRLFEADSYLMLENSGISAGVSIGIDKSFDFEVVSAGLKAWLSGDAIVTWAPQYLAGNVDLDADLWFEAFGFDFSMSAHAGIAAQTPTPKELEVDLEFTLDLPWPFDPVDVDVSMRWYEEKESSPISPLIDGASMRDFMTTDSWTLTLGTADLAGATSVTDIEPYLSAGSDALSGGMPLDARPAVTFTRNVVDNTGVASDVPVVGLEDGGDHEYGYELSYVALHKWDDDAESWSGPLDVTGYWQETGEDAATMLELLGDGPFSFCRNNSSMASGDPADAPPYWTPFTDTYLAVHAGGSGYPIDLTPTDLDFEDYDAGDVLGTHTLGSVFSGTRTAASVLVDGAGVKALPIHVSLDTPPTPTSIRVTFPEPFQLQKMKFYGMKSVTPAWVEITGTHADGTSVAVRPRFDLPNASTEFAMPVELTNLAAIVITGRNAYLEAFTYVPQSTLDAAGDMSEDAADLLEERECFEPDTIYRLSISANTYTDTRISDFIPAAATGTETRYCFFKTEGPPTELTPYVAAEVPASVASPHYAGYDLTLEFNQNYVRTMYGADIELEVLDENGAAATDDAGNAVAFETGWQTIAADAAYTTKVYLGALADAGVNVPADTTVENDILHARITSGNALPPGKRLEARFSYPDYDDPIHTIVFTTSRYADFTALVDDFRDEAWRETMDSAPAATVLTDFDAALEAFGLGRRNVPAQPDVTAFYATDRGATVALLLEIPEPVEWERVDLSVASAPGTLSRLVNGDGTRALLYVVSGSSLTAWAAGDHALSFAFHRSTGDLSELRMDGSAADEFCSATIAIP